ncbi:hypothetical protein, partial [uncultured Roseovarius sp.]|uniref:hypothetical protein n=1 Tax=uncultured Roseovarius sp. TaxID=293344 RepID=UPI00260DC682
MISFVFLGVPENCFTSKEWLKPNGVPPLKWSTNWDSIIPFQEDQEMAGKRDKPEEIVLKLRQVEV